MPGNFVDKTLVTWFTKTMTTWNTTGRKTQRLYPRDIQTGDFIRIAFQGGARWTLVTNLTPAGRYWDVEYLLVDGDDGSMRVSANSKHPVKR